MPRNALAVLGVVAVLAAAGCTKEAPEFTANDQVPAAQRIEPEGAEGGVVAPAAAADGVWVVEGSDLVFNQAPAALPAGEVTITLENMSGLPHNIAFDGVQGGQPVVDAQGNDAATGTVTLAPGTYTFFCNVAGHRESGMEGQLTVE
ncbi:MAG: plastocyanin/azurin family copper-binding protein [Egibacteraceae bacterium]